MDEKAFIRICFFTFWLYRILLEFYKIYCLTWTGSNYYPNSGNRRVELFMYHARFNGTHYEIGYRWGNRLKQNGKEILTNVPFPITEERLDFGEKSEPFYREFFPEILDEIRGIADGQSCSYPQLIAVLFSMYCIIPSINANCSCFAARIDQNGVILGRNSDFLTEIENLYMNTIYKFTSDSYSFTGNTTAFVEIEDGINEHGLAIVFI